MLIGYFFYNLLSYFKKFKIISFELSLNEETQNGLVCSSLVTTIPPLQSTTLKNIYIQYLNEEKDNLK